MLSNLIKVPTMNLLLGIGFFYKAEDSIPRPHRIKTETQNSHSHKDLYKEALLTSELSSDLHCCLRDLGMSDLNGKAQGMRVGLEPTKESPTGTSASGFREP